LAADLPQPPACEAHLGLARICYEWNDLEAAEQHGQQSLSLARQMENTDRSIAGEVVLARLKLAQGDVAGAATLLAGASQSVRRHNLVFRRPEVAAAQVLTWLRQGQLVAAMQLAERHDLPLSQARVYLAQGDPSAAMAVLSAWRGQAEAKRLEDERLKVLILQALALQAQREQDQAVQLLLDALALAEPEGFIRTFVDEGCPMLQLLSAAAAQGLMPNYLAKLLSVCDAEKQHEATLAALSVQPLVEPLSRREREVLQLIAQGCSNEEIARRLVLAVSTVKGHNLKIFDKLQVQRRTEAVARARELGLL
jgi:LuxR family maltose regulon positive regulatory protein